jgi:putative transposase
VRQAEVREKLGVGLLYGVTIYRVQMLPSALRFRLYPSREQEAKMLVAIDTCRQLWNEALSHRKTRWEKERRSTSYNLQQWILTEVRHADPSIAALYSQVAQDVLHRLDRTFKAYFKHRSRYPRSKRRSSSGSFTYPQAYNGSAKPDALRRRLYLSKIGNVNSIFHRPIPKDSLLKTCTVTREACGEWYASLVYEKIVPLQDITRKFTLPVGVDLGLKSLIVTSDGEEVPHPQFLRKAEKRLTRLQRSMSRKKMGSKNRFRARKRVASLHARVTRQRADFNHKLSTGLVRAHDLVVFEDLHVNNMVKNHRLAKSIHDAGWGQLVRFTSYKALSKGKLVVKVDPAYSSQECFYCGALNKMTLDVREVVCIGCGRLLRRDHNSARVVLKRGLAQVGQDMPELKPVETRPLLLQTTGGASQVNEAGTTRAETGAGSPRL